MDILNQLNDTKTLRKFYSTWSVAASKLLQQYVKDKSISWYNTKWRNKSKEIPFYIRTKAPRSFKGNIWFSSRPTNYAYAASVSRLKRVKCKFGKNESRHPVLGSKGWFTPKYYVPDFVNINNNITESLPSDSRCFVSRTTHNGTRKYKRPMLWFTKASHKSNASDVYPVTLKEQLADKLYNDSEMNKLIAQAFDETLTKFNR